MSGDPFGVIGSVIDGQFRVDQWVGEGGFSSVYKGFHLGLQEPIAIKCLKLPQSLGREVIEQFQNRFRDESRIAYRLSQGNLHIVRSITSGTTTSPSGQVIPYMVLEWLEGMTHHRRGHADFCAGLRSARVRACARRRASRHQAGKSFSRADA